MLFRVPVVVVQHKSGYTARPLFHPSPERTDDNLNRLLNKLTREVVQRLEQLARAHRHDDLARWAFAPRVAAHRHKLEITLRRRTVKLKLLFVAFEHLGRKLAFCPGVPDVWFEVARGERLEARGAEVLQEHWRQQEREAEEEGEVRPELAEVTGKAWVQVLELSARTDLPVPPVPVNPFLFLGGDSKPDGADELRRVGRCLDWLYPDELDRATLRDHEVNELARLLAEPDNRPVLLVGPRACGKTAVLHECVFRRIADAQASDEKHRGQTWLVSPQRLISGMSYVGQWEARLLAILKHARKKRHTLYFDDLVGLYLAGVTSQSTLSAAMVLKPYLEDRKVRVVAEISPEQLRVLQERDRGFADLFHVLPVREPSDADTARVLIGVQRRLEGKHKVHFGLDALPAVIDLQRRYERSAAFPGKAAAVLTRLAVRAGADRKEEAKSNPDPLAGRPHISRDEVLTDAAARSGLSLAFLDPARRLDRDEVRKDLAKQVIGQDEAVDALADVISVAKARLNDPDRPLAAFLFLGPTGVGKTETAKAAARTLFGDAERLVRFDLNEYNQPGAAARLVGTFDQPEGLLTAAVRRQPFCVLLLDEVEKAHPEVHDVLLQVLGEGRLSDAHGRPADFTHALILLTSNLGVREAEGGIGFVELGQNPTAYTREAERFFRPEFFNRLDRVIPFRKLDREQMGRIAHRLVAEVLAREGFAQRQCVMVVSPQAVQRVVDAGYDPQLGARAMKRAVERELTKPAAARLASLAADELTVVTVRTDGPALGVSVQAPGWAPRIDRGPERTTAERITSARDALDQIDEQIAALRPTQAVVSGKVTAEQERYFALKELADEIADTLDALEERAESKRNVRFETVQPDALGRKPRYRVTKPSSWSQSLDQRVHQPFSSLFAALSLEESLADLYDSAEALPGEPELFDLENRLALLRLMATAPPDDRPTFVWVRGFPTGPPEHTDTVTVPLILAYQAELGVEVGIQRVKNLPPTDRVFELKGFHARPLARTDEGTHLVLPTHGGPLPVRVVVTDKIPDPYAETEFGPILRVYPHGKPILDVRTGLVAAPPYAGDVLRAFVLAVLPTL